jgi:hypothetical protein
MDELLRAMEPVDDDVLAALEQSAGPFDAALVRRRLALPRTRPSSA